MYKEESFRLGECFLTVSEDMIPENWIDGDEDGYWFIPSIVNMAFSCELFFKSLISNGKNEEKGHNFYELFNKLSIETREKIINHPFFKGDDEFIEKMKEYGKLFEDWRYYFEESKSCSVDLIFLERLTVVLHETAREELNSVYE